MQPRETWRNKTAIRGAKRRNNKGQVVREPRVFPFSPRFSLYASSSWRTSELSIRCAPSGKNQRNPRRDPARQSYALFMRIAKCTRASQIRIYYCYSPSIRAVKSAPVFRGSCRLIIGWLWSVTTNRSFVVSQLGIYFKIRVLDREEEGWEWEKQREGKLPGAN